jgi:hypothetical protein
MEGRSELGVNFLISMRPELGPNIPEQIKYLWFENAVDKSRFASSEEKNELMGKTFQDFLSYIAGQFEPMELSDFPSENQVKKKVAGKFGTWSNAFSNFLDDFLSLEEKIIQLKKEDQFDIVLESQEKLFYLKKPVYQRFREITPMGSA